MKNIAVFFGFLFLYLNTFAQKPDSPKMDSVSVDPKTNMVMIGWKTVPLVDGYFVKRQIFNHPSALYGSFNTVEEIYDKYQSSYKDTSSEYGKADPVNKRQTYTLVAYDSVGVDLRLSDLSEVHSTIHVLPIEYDLCYRTNTVKWTRYVGWSDSIIEYQVYLQIESGNPFMIARKTKEDTILIHSGIAPLFNYKYFVKAVHTKGFRTTSNSASVYAYLAQQPLIFNADYATYLSDSIISISISTSSAVGLSKYKVFSIDPKNHSILDTIGDFNALVGKIEFTDTLKSPFDTVNYIAFAYTICEDMIDTSNIAQNIVLKAEPAGSDYGKVAISWLPNKYWLGGVGEYKLYRFIDDEFPSLISTFSSLDSFYIDDLTPIISTRLAEGNLKGKICYYIEAIEGDTNPYGIKSIQFSNKVCANLEPSVYVPNAFNPESTIDENRIFRPKISFVNSYRMIIYSRWGNKIFESNDPSTGWDGKYQGKFAQEGCYMYYIKYTTFDEKTEEKIGSITLFYP